MRPDMVYHYPIWAVGLSLAIVAVIGTIVLEFAVRYFVSPAVRRQHNDIAAAIFSIVGVTYAVLLAFVAMLVWRVSTRRRQQATSRPSRSLMSFRLLTASPNR